MGNRLGWPILMVREDPLIKRLTGASNTNGLGSNFQCHGTCKFTFLCVFEMCCSTNFELQFLGAPCDLLSSQSHTAQRYWTTPDACLIVTVTYINVQFYPYGPKRTMLVKLFKCLLSAKRELIITYVCTSRSSPPKTPQISL